MVDSCPKNKQTEGEEQGIIEIVVNGITCQRDEDRAASVNPIWDFQCPFHPGFTAYLLDAMF
jgi:hypothetical protein